MYILIDSLAEYMCYICTNVCDWCGPPLISSGILIRFLPPLMPSLPPDAQTLLLTLSLSASATKTVASTVVVYGVNMESKITVMVAILLTSLFGLNVLLMPRITIYSPL